MKLTMYLFTRLTLAMMIVLSSGFISNRLQAQALPSSGSYSGAQLTSRLNSAEDSIIIRLEAYYDCPTTASFGNTTSIFRSSSCGNSFVTLNKVSDTEVSDVCASSLPFCNNGGSLSGERMVVYEGSVELSAEVACGVITYYTFSPDRTDATNIQNLSSSDRIRPELILNLPNDSLNSTPTFAANERPFICSGVNVGFDPLVTDVDGDSMVFSLRAPQHGSTSGTNYNYVAGYSANDPTGNGLTIDSETGILDFSAPASGIFQVVIQVQEYGRTSGNLLSTGFRDFQIEVDTSCSNAGPSVAANFTGTSNVSSSIANDTIVLDTGIAASWALQFTGDAGETVSLSTTASSALNGAAVSTSATSNTTALTINWTPTGSDIGTHIYSISAEDDDCDVIGRSAHKVVVVVQGSSAPVSITSVDVVDETCAGAKDGQITINKTDGVGPFGYFIVFFSGGLDTIVQPTNVFTDLDPISYNVFVVDSNDMTRDSATVNVGAGINFFASGFNNILAACDTICNGRARVQTIFGGNPKTYLWDDGVTTQTNSTLCGGLHTVTVTEATNSCEVVSSIVIPDGPVLYSSVDSTDSVTCNGGSDGAAFLSAHGGYAESTSTNEYLIDQTLGSFEPYDTSFTGGTSVSLADDAVSAPLSIGFSFEFFGTSNTQFRISSNGFITFSSTANGCCSGQSMPNATQPNDLIAAYWEDLNPAAGGEIEYYTIGASPNRALVVNFKDVPHWPNSNPVTFQIVLHETSNIIEVFGTNLASDGGSHTQGLENSGGTNAFFVTGRNAANWSATNDYVAFIPEIQNFTYTWSSIGSGDSDTNLTAGSYTVTVTDPRSCENILNFSIEEPSPIIIDTALTEPLCNGDTTGQIVASASGSNGAPFTFLWNTGASGATLSPVPAGTYTVTATDSKGCTEDLTVTLDDPDPVVASINVDSNISCNGGSNGQLTATGSGGTPGYTFSWSPAGNTATISGLNDGTYTVTVTDNNGCTAEATQVLTEPTPVSVTIQGSTNVSCVGGSDGTATANNASGGTPNYTYLWSSGATGTSASGLSAGTYTVTATDANGCTDTAEVTITQPATGVSISINSITNVDCNGDTTGAITANAATGGSGGYTYLWSNGGTALTNTGLTAGTYTITVTDAGGCTDTASATVTEPLPLTVDTTSVQNPSCGGANDGSITVTGVGGSSPYSYLWSSGGTSGTESGLSTGTYTVTVTDDNTCSQTLSITLTAPSGISVTISVDSNVSCLGGSNGQLTATPSGGSSPFTYAWSPSGNTQTISNLSAGSYTVTVTDDNGCTGTATESITEPGSAVVASIASSSDVSCFNGSDGEATAAGAGGTPGYSFLWSNASTVAAISGLTVGTYSVTVTDNNGCTDSTSVTISQPTSGVSISINSTTNVDCNGNSTGSIVANAATGGTPGYTYLWSNGGSNLTNSNLAAGTYTITVTDNNGCTDTVSATVTEPPVLIIDTTSTTEPTCATSANGSITVAASGGTPGFNYLWNTGSTSATINNLNAGNYTVTVTDNNLCTEELTVSLGDQGGIDASITVNSNLTCVGDSTGELTASGSNGTAPYTFAWSNSETSGVISNLGAGTYTVTVTDNNGCTDTAQATITAPSPIVFTTFTNISTPSCDDACDGAATASATGGSGSLSYAWSSGSTTASASGLCGGGHTVTITDGNGCSITESIGLVEPPSLFAQLDSFSNVDCNGNASGEAYLSAHGGVASSSSTNEYIIDQTQGSFEPYPKGQPWNANSYQSFVLDDDANSPAINIFGSGSFSFFGQNKTQFVISSQGLITFDLTQANIAFQAGMYSTTAAIPNNGGALDPSDFIAGYWHDLFPDTLPSGPLQTVIETYELGSSPNRVRVVNYINIDHWNAATPPPPGFRSTFQIALYESSNIIQIHSDSLISDGGNHVQGIENAAENAGYAVSGRNNTNFETDNDYVAFIPSS
ncbi:MAG: hypothetical protein WEC59_09915, partial [Salibacteraceae bacterium]